MTSEAPAIGPVPRAHLRPERAAGGTTGTGATVPKGATVYSEVKIRSTTGDGGF